MKSNPIVFSLTPVKLPDPSVPLLNIRIKCPECGCMFFQRPTFINGTVSVNCFGCLYEGTLYTLMKDLFEDNNHILNEEL